MESSSSETPKQSVVDDCEDVVQSFGRLGLSKYGTFDSANNNASSSSCTNNIPFVAQQSFHKTPWFSGNSVSNHGSIWGNSLFFTGGDKGYKQEKSLFSNVNNHGQGNFWNSIDQKDRYLGLCGLDEFAASTSNNANNGPIFNYQQNQNRSLIEEILKGEPCVQKKGLIYELQRSVFMLMIDNEMNSIFQAFIDACEGDQLSSLVGIFLCERELFIETAFCKQGANSIGKLIKKLKKSHHAFIVTQILSTKLWNIMTNQTAGTVIRKCFILFGNEPNKILYERIIDQFWDLAIHKVGCISLNECISTIAGQQRSKLLNRIAHVSDHLSYDEYGNFVVQNVVTLGHNDVTDKILHVLKGHYIELAQDRRGSHLIEKCMEYSKVGCLFVVEDILKSPTAPCLLAHHEFGNYVIQCALNKTKRHGYSEIYNSLVKSLQLYREDLNQTTGGRIVINLIQDLS